MAKRVLVLRAGTGSSNNLIRSLKAGDASLIVSGCHDDRFVLKKSPADRNYLIPSLDQPKFLAALRRLIKTERVDLLIPSSDADVKTVSDLRDGIPCRLFLPAKALIDRCQDKFELTTFMRAHDLPAPVTYPVTDLDAIDEIFHRLSPYTRLWCRMRAGTGSMGALPVKTPEQARSWMGYWADMRGVPVSSFTISEYLPGRDFAAQSLWKDGTLVLVKVCERISYFGGGNVPSGASSTPALAKLVDEPRVVDVCTRAIRALDDNASGVFGIDLKENARGVPCITEINAGRFFMITNIFDLTGKHNMAALYVRLALGEPVEIRDEHDVAGDDYLVRDLDTLPGIFHADQLFDGIVDLTR